MNIEEICKYFVEGEKTTKRLGIELEHFVCDANMNLASYTEISDCINEIAKKNGGKILYENEFILGLEQDEYLITLEPAAQVEISINPQSEISEIQRIYQEFRAIWDLVLEKKGYAFVQKGVYPLVERGKISPDEINLIPKKRYYYMDKYFKNTGTYGKYMMKATAATHISIDYASMKDAMRKIRLLEIISPLLALWMENQSGMGIHEIWDKHTIRTQIWNNLDTDRCGYLPNSLDTDYGYEAYAKHILSRPDIFRIEEKDTKYIEYLISMIFPCVRLKRYIEIRVADSVSQEKMLGYVALIKGLMYSETALCKLEELFGSVIDIEEIVTAEKRIISEGYHALVYGKEAVDWLITLYDLAENQLSSEDNQYLKSMRTLQMAEKQYYNLVSRDFKIHVESANSAKKYIQESTAKYHNRAVRTLYIPKIFTTNETEKFAELVKQLYTIFDKVIFEYENNQEYRKLFNFSSVLEELILRERTYSVNIPIARIDIFYNEETSEFQFCEFNTDGTSAMNEDRELNKALKLTKAYKEMEKKYTISTCELFDSWIDEFLKNYEAFAKKYQHKKIPNVAIVDFMEFATENEFKIFQERFLSREIQCEICDIRELKWNGKECIAPSGMVVDAIYRRAVTTDILAKQEEVTDLIEAVRANAVCLVGDFRTQIVHNKILFKILHLPQTKKLLCDEENEYIKAHVPYTVSLTTDLFNTNAELQAEVLNKKDGWIIKPEDSYGSHGVHAGTESTKEEWGERVQECIDKTYILQRFYDPYVLKNMDLTAIENDTFKWSPTSNLTGLFVYNGLFKGMYSRISYDKMISTQYNEMSLPTIIVS